VQPSTVQLYCFSTARDRQRDEPGIMRAGSSWGLTVSLEMHTEVARVLADEGAPRVIAGIGFLPEMHDAHMASQLLLE
jgi:hypothetical protein